MAKELLGGLELNRIYQRDCLSDGGMALIPDKSIDMILCDLPYGTTPLKWDTVLDINLMWEQYERIIKENGAIVLFGYQPFSSLLVTSKLELFKYAIVWDKVSKSDIMNAKNKPLRQHEDILVFSKGTVANGSNRRMKYFPQGVTVGVRVNTNNIQDYEGATKVARPSHEKVYKTQGANYPTSIIRFSNANRMNAYHPTQKPVDLFEYLIRTYTNEGEIVLDNCMGSGTTAVAALNTNRRFIGFETEPTYIEIANKRIEGLI
jgi:site-specific DNA-methyltransferase (adenine-specific)